jgi:polysaccharide pyruvyl transferase WcaK-like protein
MASDAKKNAIIFANLKGNVGDYAILEAMLRDLSMRFPSHGIDVYPHPLTPVDKIRFEEFQRLAPAFNLMRKTMFDTKSAYWRIAGMKSRESLHPLREIFSFIEGYRPFFSKFSQYEQVFVAGGEQFVGPRLSVCMFATLICIREYNSNIYAYPFSVRPGILKLYNREDLSRFFGVLRKPIVVRDGITNGVFRKLGIDAVVGLDCVHELMSLTRSIAPQEGRQQNRVIYAVSGRNNFVELCTGVEQIIKSGRDVEVLTTCYSEDGSVIRKISEMFSIKWRAPTSWQETVSEFKASSLVVTNRLHGLILGSLAETTLLPVTDRKKPEAFVIDAEMPYHVKSPELINSDLLEKVDGDRNLIKKRMAEYHKKATSLHTGPFTQN